MSRSWKSRKRSTTWRVQAFEAKRSDWVTVLENYRSIAAAFRKARMLARAMHVRVVDADGIVLAQWANGKRLTSEARG
jgi:hypothetical protein